MVVKNADDKTVQEYKFLDFSGQEFNNDTEVRTYGMNKLDSLTVSSEDKRDKLIRAERSFAHESGFRISSIVKSHRGTQQQEEQEYEERVRADVELQMTGIREKAFKKGHEEGIEQGRKEVYEKMREISEEKLDQLREIIGALMNEKEDLLRKEKEDVYNLVKNLTKWIILRELEEDNDYIRRLIEKLVSEIGNNQKVLVQVSQNQFERIPEILEFIQEFAGRIDNVRVEVDYDISDKGVVIETENGIIKGTLEEQFVALDRLFENAGLGNGSRREAA